VNREFPHVLAAFYGVPWAILPAKLAEIEAVLIRRLKDGPRADGAEVPDVRTGPRGARPGEVRTDDGYTLVGSAAVVPVTGTITPRASVFSEWSGGSSADRIGRAMDAAVADTRVDGIVLDVDSPGGSAFGLPDAAAKIAAANKQKPVTAVVNHMAASAAYWLASQAGTIAAAPGSWLGCIGCIMAHVDETKLEEMAGVRTTLISSTQSPFKTESYPQVPLSAEARADLQRQTDKVAQEFIDAVAKGRGIRSATVERDFGQGRMKLADEAVAARMADRVATLEQVVNEINARRSRSSAKRVAADLAAMGLPTA
jgi:signal peptide peptidase SppA